MEPWKQTLPPSVQISISNMRIHVHLTCDQVQGSDVYMWLCVWREPGNDANVHCRADGEVFQASGATGRGTDSGIAGWERTNHLSTLQWDNVHTITESCERFCVCVYIYIFLLTVVIASVPGLACYFCGGEKKEPLYYDLKRTIIIFLVENLCCGERVNFHLVPITCLYTLYCLLLCVFFRDDPTSSSRGVKTGQDSVCNIILQCHYILQWYYRFYLTG